MADNTNSPLAIRAQVGTIASLATADKTDVVAAINEVALGHIVKVATDGTRTITGDPTGTAAEKFDDIKTAIAALDNFETLYLPNWYCETNGTNASISSKKGVLIDFGNCKIKATGAVSGNCIFKATGCYNSVFRGINIDANDDSTTGDRYCYAV